MSSWEGIESQLGETSGKSLREEHEEGIENSSEIMAVWYVKYLMPGVLD